MKKITLLLFLFITGNIFSQTYTSGPIMVAADYTVQFDVDTDTDIVTITLIGPDDKWFGVGPGIAAGNGMGDLGDDTNVFGIPPMGSTAILQDRNMPTGTSTPNVDTSQDLNLTSNVIDTGVRTVIYTRPINTGDVNDYTYPSTATTFPFLWVRGTSINIGYHQFGNKGGAMANMVLGTDDFQQEPNFTISPNPARELMNIKLNPRIHNARLQVYDVLGKRIMDNGISEVNSSVNVSNWNKGIYIVRVLSGDSSETKRFVKQ